MLVVSIFALYKKKGFQFFWRFWSQIQFKREDSADIPNFGPLRSSVILILIINLKFFLNIELICLL